MKRAHPYTPPTDAQVRAVIDAAKATGMPLTALRWAMRELSRRDDDACPEGWIRNRWAGPDDACPKCGDPPDRPCAKPVCYRGLLREPE